MARGSVNAAPQESTAATLMSCTQPAGRVCSLDRRWLEWGKPRQFTQPIRPSPMMRIRPYIFVLVLVSLLDACGGGREPGPRRPALAKAYVGAQTLPLRKELSAHSEVVTTGKFGEKVDILRRLRMSMLIRTADNKSGWVDARMLIREQEMEMLEQLKRDYKSTPSMGTARPYDELNIHTSPSRGSPTLETIKEQESVEVLGHRVALRTAYLPTAVPPSLKGKKKKGKREELPMDELPAPKPPPLPADWQAATRPAPTEPNPDERKKMRRDAVKNAFLLKGEQDRRANPLGPTYDDWSLVRTPTGQVGWALATALVMALPDDILQYAQRQRITSFFRLGEVSDPEKGTKGTWFWTTSSRKGQTHQFDAMRLFLFNTKRHRYETAFQLKDQIGYFPVEVTGVKEGKPQISVILEDGGGQCWRRRFVYENNRLRLLDQVKVQKPRQPQAPEDLPVTSIPDPPEDEEQTWWGQTLKSLFGK